MLTCGTIFAAEVDCGTSAANPCYADFTRPVDGTIYYGPWYYENGVYGNIIYPKTNWKVKGCAAGYYMPDSALYSQKCRGETWTSDTELAIEECCWACPFPNEGDSIQNCYYIHPTYGTEMPVAECDGEWCRSSKPGKDIRGGVSTCLATIDKDSVDVSYGSDSTGEWQIGSACGFYGSEKDITEPCKCWPRTSYTQYCG